MIPLRAQCYYEGRLDWWITTDRGRTWTRTSDWTVATVDELIVNAHGLMDQECWAFFTKSHQARYQPSK